MDFHQFFKKENLYCPRKQLKKLSLHGKAKYLTKEQVLLKIKTPHIKVKQLLGDKSF